MNQNTSEDIKFVPLPEFSGGIYAEMVKEALENEGITCFISSEGIEGAFGISGTLMPTESVKLLVPASKYEFCLRVQQEIMEK